MRIVSLLPSATDIVCALGLRGALVGRTHECDWPPGIESVPVMTADRLDTERMTSREIHDAVGGAVHSGSSIYALDVEALERAKPDLIVTQELCEVCAVSYREVAEAARMMQGVGPTVVSLEPHSIDEILENVALVGRLTGAEDAARRLVEDARDRLGRLRESNAGREPVRTVCIEWLDPIFVGGHWVPEQVEHAGGIDVLGPRGGPSHEVAWDEVVGAAPEALFLMPCGVSIDKTLDELDSLRARPRWDQLPAVRAGRVWAVDGSSYFNRPGPRVVEGAEILAACLRAEDLKPGRAVYVQR